MIRKVIGITSDMETTLGSLPGRPDFNAGSGSSQYIINIKFIDNSSLNTRLDVFEAIKKLGVFNIQNLKNHIYILEFKSQFIKDELAERLKELAGPDKLFDYTIE